MAAKLSTPILGSLTPQLEGAPHSAPHPVRCPAGAPAAQNKKGGEGDA
jgi:hypothetical protein